MSKGIGYGFVGYGALGQQVRRLFPGLFASTHCVVFDDDMARPPAGPDPVHPFASHTNEAYAALKFIVALGYRHPDVKLQVLDQLERQGRSLATLIHSTCHVHFTAQVYRGAILYPMCNIDQDVGVCSGAVLNNSVVASHGCRIGRAAFLAPGVVLSGNVTVGEGAFLGAGSIVADGVSIGDRAIVGVGTVVTTDVAAGASVIGSPMRILDRPLRL